MTQCYTPQLMRFTACELRLQDIRYQVRFLPEVDRYTTCTLYDHDQETDDVKFVTHVVCNDKGKPNIERVFEGHTEHVHVTDIKIKLFALFGELYEDTMPWLSQA